MQNSESWQSWHRRLTTVFFMLGDLGMCMALTIK